MITTARLALHASASAATRHARILGEAGRLARDLDRQLGQATAQLQEVGQTQLRGRRCELLRELGKAWKGEHAPFLQRAADLPRLQGGEPDPELSCVRRQAAALRWLDILQRSGVRLLQAYEPGQLPFEPLRMVEARARALTEGVAGSLAGLGASGRTTEVDDAGLALAVMPPALRSAADPGPAEAQVARAAQAWLERHGGLTLDPQQFLMLCLVAHPDAGAFPVFSSLEVLEGLCKPLGAAGADLFKDFDALRESAIEAAYGLEGLRVTSPDGSLYKAMDSRDNPLLESTLQDYAVFALTRSLSATRDARHAFLGQRGTGASGDVLLMMDGGGPAVGPVAAVRADLFHPERTRQQAEVLVLRRQGFRVEPPLTHLHRDPEGGSTEVRVFRLNKLGDPAGDMDRLG